MVIKKGILLPIMIGYLLNININAVEKIAFKPIMAIKSKTIAKTAALSQLKDLKIKLMKHSKQDNCFYF